MSTDELARRLAMYEEQAEQLAERIKGLRTQLLDTLQPGETVTVDGQPLYKAMPGKRTFNQKTAAELLPFEVAARCSETAIVGAEVKRISPALWEQCCTIGQPYLRAVRG